MKKTGKPMRSVTENTVGFSFRCSEEQGEAIRIAAKLSERKIADYLRFVLPKKVAEENK